MLSRKNLRILNSFGSDGNDPGQFHWLHNVAGDPKGYIYTVEVNTGRHTQKLVYQGNIYQGKSGAKRLAFAQHLQFHVQRVPVDQSGRFA